MTITAHFLREDVLKHTAVDFFQLPSPHTGDAIADATAEVVEAFGVGDKVVAITSDNAISNKRAVDILASSGCLPNFGLLDWHRCIAHVLHLVATESVVNIKQDLASLRHLVETIRRSPKLKAYYHKQCDEHLKKRLDLIADCSTRWNSAFDMDERAREVKGILSIMTSSGIPTTSRLQQLRISDDVWQRLDDVKQFLMPFSEISNKLSASSYSTLSLVVPTFLNLVEHLESIGRSRDDDSSISKMARATVNKLNTYREHLVNESTIIATIFDPRFKLEIFDDVSGEAYRNILSAK